MSQHTYRTRTSNKKKVIVTLGYDRPLDFVFCSVLDEHESVIYSNLDDDNAGTELQDVDYYRSVLLDLGIRVPEEIFGEVKSDQLLRVGNRAVDHTVLESPSKLQCVIDTLVSKISGFVKQVKEDRSHGS